MASLPPPDTARSIALAEDAHARLVLALEELGDGLDIAAPSRLPGWTKGHVVTHIINSGEGNILMFDGAAAGEVAAQYPGGREQRAADIEAGAGRPAAEQLAALRRSCTELERRWAESDWRGSGMGALGEIPLTDLPFVRIREVEIHHVDLDIGYEFADLPAEYVRLEIRRMEMLWRARQPMGFNAFPARARELAPADRLAWFTGRVELPGLEPANLF